MIVVGLTGGIATGKSTTADLFRERGLAVFDADICVHEFLDASGLAVEKVREAFGSGVLKADGSVDRHALGRRVFQCPFDRKKLEQILHPLVAAKREEFLLQERLGGAELAVLDVPLLFEAGTNELCDLVVVVKVTLEVQRARAMSREDMTSEKLTGILNSQMPLKDKVSQADFVLDTGTDLNTTRRQLFDWLDHILV